MHGALAHVSPVAVPPLVAAGLVQPFGAPLVLALAVGLAFYGFRHGLFLATLAGLHALAATLAALGLTGPVAAWLELAEVPRAFATPAAFLGVLAVAAVGLGLAIGAVPAGAARLPPVVDKVGGVIVGGLAGLLAAGALLLAASFAPLPPAYRLDGSRLVFDMGGPLLGVFSRCLGLDREAREVVLHGEPGAASAGGPAARPAWSEPFLDANGNLARDEGEAFVDTDGDGRFTAELSARDTNGNGRRDVGLLEHYRLGHWLPLTTVQAPVITSKDTAYVTDHAPVETVVYEATATDVDAGDGITFSLEPGLADDAALVLVDPAKGTVTLKSPPDREHRRLYEFTVMATDKAGLAARQHVKLHVTKPLKGREEPSPGHTPASP
ncbi:MAG: cadherin repeat domain-containing protein [Planctomycetia bacterium]|nr:cadherin repeat domain-containing protein [Planctomycetia bacterium]